MAQVSPLTPTDLCFRCQLDHTPTGVTTDTLLLVPWLSLRCQDTLKPMVSGVTQLTLQRMVWTWTHSPPQGVQLLIPYTAVNSRCLSLSGVLITGVQSPLAVINRHVASVWFGVKLMPYPWLWWAPFYRTHCTNTFLVSSVLLLVTAYYVTELSVYSPLSTRSLTLSWVFVHNV